MASSPEERRARWEFLLLNISSNSLLLAGGDIHWGDGWEGGGDVYWGDQHLRHLCGWWSKWKFCHRTVDQIHIGWMTSSFQQTRARQHMRQISPEWDAGWEGGMSILEGRSTIEPFWNISGYTLPHQQAVYNFWLDKKRNSIFRKLFFFSLLSRLYGIL